MEKLTGRQEKVLKFIQTSYRKKGFPPTIREIADHLGVKWTRGVEGHLEALAKKGHITRARDMSRGIKLAFRPAGINVPLIGRITAGRPILAVENIEDQIMFDTSMVRGENNFLLRVEGMSMRDAGILDGDLILVRSQQSAESGDIVAALINDEEATVKRLRLKPNGVVLEPANPDYQSITSAAVSISIIGKVMAVLRLLDNQMRVAKVR